MLEALGDFSLTRGNLLGGSSGAPGGKTYKSVAAPTPMIGISGVLTLDLSALSLQQFVNYGCSFPTLALLLLVASA